MKTLRKFHNGFSLVTAIFLLVVLASLGAVMVTFFTTQQQGSALDIMGSRAYQAARSGIEWGAYQVLQGAGCPTGGPTLSGSLSAFSVTVTCAAITYSEISAASGTVTVYNMTSTAKTGTEGQPDYVERQMSVALTK
jgi:MSHA biogenesis protein MshP